LAAQIDEYIYQHSPNSPLLGEGYLIVQDSIQYGVDPRTLVGIQGCSVLTDQFVARV